MDFFQCFNFFYAGLVFCEVLDFYGEIFKHSYRFLQVHKIIPRHWLASLLYTIHIKDAEKVQQETPMRLEWWFILKGYIFIGYFTIGERVRFSHND